MEPSRTFEKASFARWQEGEGSGIKQVFKEARDKYDQILIFIMKDEENIEVFMQGSATEFQSTKINLVAL